MPSIDLSTIRNYITLKQNNIKNSPTMDLSTIRNYITLKRNNLIISRC